MDKNQAIELINKKQGKTVLSQKNTHWANLTIYGGKDGWWINVPFNKFKENLYFILNNEKSGRLLYVAIPKKAIDNPCSIFRNKKDTADIFITSVNPEILRKKDTLIDEQSNGTKHDFSVYQVELIEHSIVSDSKEHLYPEEVPNNCKEGSKKTIVVNSYERNSKARAECIKKYGVNCTVCEFNFKNIYGERGDGFIHVHHLIPLSDLGDEYEIDPIKDLRPVCPNCHAMLHRNGNISIEELLNEIKSKTN